MNRDGSQKSEHWLPLYPKVPQFAFNLTYNNVNVALNSRNPAPFVPDSIEAQVGLKSGWNFDVESAVL